MSQETATQLVAVFFCLLMLWLLPRRLFWTIDRTYLTDSLARRWWCALLFGGGLILAAILAVVLKILSEGEAGRLIASVTHLRSEANLALLFCLAMIGGSIDGAFLVSQPTEEQKARRAYKERLRKIGGTRKSF